MLTIKEVTTKKDLKKFISFQNELYKDSPYYVPTLMSDEMSNLTKGKNPAFEFCDIREWLCYDENGKIVGRVAGIISNEANRIWNQKHIRFSRIDFIEDYDVFCLLMKTVEDWGRERGLAELIGPMGFCDQDKEGMLIDGFDKMGMFITYYNHPYYAEFMKRYGFGKEVDWLEHRIYSEFSDKKMGEKLDDTCAKILEKQKLHFADISTRRKLKPYVQRIFVLLNDTYKDLYGVVPVTQGQMDYYAGMFLIMLNLNYVSLIVDDEDNLVSLGILAPSFVRSMRKCKGHMFPFGWIYMLRDIKKPKVLDMYFIAVTNKYKNTGLPLVLINTITKAAYKNGVEYAETGPELENNINVQGLWKGHKTDLSYRRRRCFIKEL